MYRLYVLYSNFDYKIRYVGITKKKLQRRINNHIWEAKSKKTHKTHKLRWINSIILKKYLIFGKTVKKFDTLEKLKNSEIYLISLLKDKNYNLTNSTKGGDFVSEKSPEGLKKLRNNKLGKKWSIESRIKLSNSKKGISVLHNKKWSKISREKASIAKLGKPSLRKKKINQYTLNMEFIKEWNSLTEAANYYNISIGSISQNISNITKTANKFIWKSK